MARFVFILSNITAVVQVFFNYLKSKVVRLNKKITLHSIFGLMVIAILNGKIISAIGMYGFAWIYLSIIILGYFFISASTISNSDDINDKGDKKTRKKVFYYQ